MVKPPLFTGSTQVRFLSLQMYQTKGCIMAEMPGILKWFGWCACWNCGRWIVGHNTCGDCLKKFETIQKEKGV